MWDVNTHKKWTNILKDMKQMDRPRDGEDCPNRSPLVAYKNQYLFSEGWKTLLGEGENCG